MAYNRWLAPDELEHHQIKGAKWHVHNGPPYPLSRQEKFRTYAPDGHPITSKKAYKKAMSVERAKHKEERSKHLNGTPEDHRERDSLVARVKRGYRQYKNEQKELVKRNAQLREDNKLFDEAVERVNNIEGLTDKEQKELSDILAKQDHDKSIKGSRNAKQLADEVNSFADRIEKEHREAAKEHGTAEEVMKYRESFTKEEWTEIANRLEAEARVRKLLDKPFEGNTKQNQNNNSNQPVSKSGENQQFRDSLAKKLYKEGTAREVYNYRKGFTPEQLNSVTDRLKAEETVGKYAKDQINLKSNQQIALEKIRDYIGIAGDTFDSLGKIKKFFSGGSGGNSKPNRNK